MLGFDGCLVGALFGQLCNQTFVELLDLLLLAFVDANIVDDEIHCDVRILLDMTESH